MTQSELEQALKGGKIQAENTPDTTPQTHEVGQPTLPDFLPLLSMLRAPLNHLTAAPTFTPKNFLEQIQFVDDGTDQWLYLYINKTWRYVALT